MDDLIMSSTTDTPEQIREGLGLDAVVTDPAVDAAADETDAADTATPYPAPASTVAETDDAPVVDDPPAAKPEAVAKPAAPAKKPITREQRRIDAAAAAARRAADAEAATLKAHVAALTRRVEELTAPPVPVKPKAGEAAPVADPGIAATFAQQREALGPRPKQADFEDFDEYETTRDEWLEKRAALTAQEQIAQQGAARHADLARQDAERDASQIRATWEASQAASAKRHADHQQVMAAADAQGLALANHLIPALHKTKDLSGEVAYHLASHPDELTRLNAMDPIDGLMEFGRLADRVRATLSPSRRAPMSVVRNISRAPEPQGTELGASPSAASDDLENAPDQAAYNRMRDRQIQARYGGRRR